MAYRLLWADDEIELLNGHIIFLESKGYEVVTVTNGRDAIEACRNEDFDLMLLDENMPGLSGLETLVQVKEIRPALPVVMVPQGISRTASAIRKRKIGVCAFTTLLRGK